MALNMSLLGHECINAGPSKHRYLSSVLVRIHNAIPINIIDNVSPLAWLTLEQVFDHGLRKWLVQAIMEANAARLFRFWLLQSHLAALVKDHVVRGGVRVRTLAFLRETHLVAVIGCPFCLLAQGVLYYARLLDKLHLRTSFFSHLLRHVVRLVVPVKWIVHLKLLLIYVFSMAQPTPFLSSIRCAILNMVVNMGYTCFSYIGTRGVSLVTNSYIGAIWHRLLLLR